MDWVKWAIPLVVVGVYIVSQLAAQLRDAKRRPNRNLPPTRPDDSPSTPPRPRAQRPSPEMDRFLEEVRRRQQPPPAQPRPVQERPRPQPSPRPVVLAPASTSAPARPVVRTSPRPPNRKIPEAVPAAIATLPTQTLPVISAPPPPPPTRVSVSADKPASAAVYQVLDLLRDRQSLATAVLLREILDPPLCRRGWRGPGRR